MNKLNLFADFTKSDDEQKMVWGYASTDALDSHKEIVTKSAIEQSLNEYMRFANIREMHQPSAVGVCKEASMDDKGLYIGVKVVDETAWMKVKEGVYKGFSIGGSALKREGNMITQLKLTEISLVDRPANPEALIEVFKFEGDTTMNLQEKLEALLAKGELTQEELDILKAKMADRKEEEKEMKEDPKEEATETEEEMDEEGKPKKKKKEKMEDKESEEEEKCYRSEETTDIQKSEVQGLTHEDIKKSIEESDLKKAFDLQATELQKALDAINKFNGLVNDLEKRLKHLEDTPVNPKGQLTVVNKDGSIAKSESSQPLSGLDAFKEALRNPTHINLNGY